MRLLLFSCKPYDQKFFSDININFDFELVFLETRLNAQTAALAKEGDAVCAFVNDDLSAPVLKTLHQRGVRFVAMRCAGYNNVDLACAKELAMTVVRVPAYSPHAVAEHSLGLMMALNRKLHRAHYRAKEFNFALDGLLGFDMYKKTAGVIGTGRIGEVLARILVGMGCNVLAYDLNPNPECEALGVRYVSLEDLFRQSDIISLHCPLVSQTYHLIDDAAFDLMREGVMLINTSRGGLVDTKAAIKALKTGKLGALGLDVYEEEAGLFFEDHSSRTILDDTFARLLTFPNVMITAHQGFFTREAVVNIVTTTLESTKGFQSGEIAAGNIVTAPD